MFSKIGQVSLSIFIIFAYLLHHCVICGNDKLFHRPETEYLTTDCDFALIYNANCVFNRTIRSDSDRLKTGPNLTALFGKGSKDIHVLQWYQTNNVNDIDITKPKLGGHRHRPRVLHGLNKFLHKLPGHCFIHLRNVNGVDYEEFQLPVLLTHPYALFLEKDLQLHGIRDDGSFVYINLWVDTFITSNNPSPFRYPFYSNGIYFWLDFLKFSMKTKPWNCEVHIDVLPRAEEAHTLKLMYENGYANFWGKHEFHPQMRNMLPSIHALKLNVLLLEENQPQLPVFDSLLIYFQKTVQDMPRLGVPNRAFTNEIGLVAEAARIGDKISLKQLSILPYRKVNGLGNGLFSDPLEMHLVGQTETLLARPETLEELLFLAMPHRITKITAGDKNKMDMTNLKESNLEMDMNQDSIYQYLFHCKEAHFLDKRNGNLVRMTTGEMAAFGHSQMWHSALKNVSAFRKDLVCPENVQVSFQLLMDMASASKIYIHYYSKDNLDIYHPLSFPIPEKSFQYVSCGRAIKEGFNFGVLVAVYDKRIWAGIGLTLLIVPICLGTLLRYFGGKAWKPLELEQCILSLIGTYKVLLEQGGFPGRFVSGHNTAKVIGPFLLVAVVLSNAYKNENVYKAIAPLCPIPYDTFESLVQNRFLIYTVGRLLNIGNVRLEAFRNFLYGRGGLSGCAKTDKHCFFVSNETTATEGQPSYKFLVKSYLSEKMYGNSNYSSYLVKKSELIPLSDMITQTPMGDLAVLGRAKKLYEEFHKYQSQLSLQILSTCEKSAIITNELEANTLAAELLNRHGTSQVYLGKTTLIQVNLGYSFEGWVPFPERFVTRLRSAQASGIWEWWSKFISEHLVKLKKGVNAEDGRQSDKAHYHREDGKQLKTPTMNGNIITVFSITAVGILASIFIFLVETFNFKVFMMNLRKRRDSLQQMLGVVWKPYSKTTAVAQPPPMKMELTMINVLSPSPSLSPSHNHKFSTGF